MRKNECWAVIPNESSPDQVARLMQDISVSRIMAELLVNRGISESDAARSFLNPSYDELGAAHAIPGMTAAVQRIVTAIERQEKVAVYGDYDADGVCSIAILKDCLDLLLPAVRSYIPNRFREGYGLNVDAISSLHEEGCQLLITVDCGISSLAEIEMCNDLHLDVIITDHHQPGKELPPALAIVNPKLGDEGPGSDLAGAGVAFQLVRALAEIYDVIEPRRYLDLVGLATVADIVPLLGDNRILVREGMEAIRQTTRPGLKALIGNAGLTAAELQYWHISFVLAPRLNAAGRLDEAAISLELLMTRSDLEARSLAEKLTVLNTTRQGIANRIFEEAEEEARLRLETGERVLVLAREGWHQGVLGIVASRLVEKCGSPVILISVEGEQGKGSGRAVAGFNMYQALDSCRGFLNQFGGHQMAAGLSVDCHQIDGLRRALNENSGAWEQGQPGTTLYFDEVIDIGDVNRELINDISRLEPFGPGNPVPLFVVRGARVVSQYRVGKKKEHLKLKVNCSGCQMDAIGFGLGDRAEFLVTGRLYDLVTEPAINDFRGTQNLQLKVHDVKHADEDDDPGFRGNLDFLADSPIEMMERSIQEQLRRNKPVLIIYPTVRCLDKHLAGLKNRFPREEIAPLHGCLSAAERQRSLENLRLGKAMVFPSTSSFFHNSISGMELCKDLQGYALWAEDRLPDDGLISWTFVDCDNFPEQVVYEQVLPVDTVGRQGMIIYTNRGTTLGRLVLAGDTVEAGVDLFSERIRRREDHIHRRAGGHFLDGAFGGGLPRMEVKEFFLGDAPFGKYEVNNCLVQFSNLPSRVIVGYSPDDLSWNRNHLNQLFPDRDYIWDLYSQLLESSADGASVVGKDLTGANRGKDLKVRAALRVLAELEMIKSSRGIWKIRTGTEARALYEPERSPYYQEGLAEKLSFEKWAAFCGEE